MTELIFKKLTKSDIKRELKEGLNAFVNEHSYRHLPIDNRSMKNWVNDGYDIIVVLSDNNRVGFIKAKEHKNDSEIIKKLKQYDKDIEDSYVVEELVYVRGYLIPILDYLINKHNKLVIPVVDKNALDVYSKFGLDIIHTRTKGLQPIIAVKK